MHFSDQLTAVYMAVPIGTPSQRNRVTALDTARQSIMDRLYIYRHLLHKNCNTITKKNVSAYLTISSNSHRSGGKIKLRGTG